MKLDIQDSKDRLDVLEGITITTINEQITAINSSITDLQEMDETLDGYINTLETTAADLMKRLKIYCIQEEKTVTFLRLGQIGQSSNKNLDI